MKKNILILFVLLNLTSMAQTYSLSNSAILSSYSMGCPIGANSGTIYDDGGSGSNYSNNIGDGGGNGFYQTFCPTTAGQSISLTFTSFNVDVTNDFLAVRNGPAQGSTAFTTAPADAFGQIWGTPSLPFTYTATNSSGCLTLEFYSDASVRKSGFEATISTTNNGSALASGNSDCSNSSFICSNTAFNDVSNGPGLVPDEACGATCLTGEIYSNWYTFTAKTSGTLGITIAPTSGDDFDYAVFGPNSSCGASAPIRCSFASGNTNTGMGNGALDTSEDPAGDGWTAPLNVIAGETYQLMINNWSPGGTGFNLSFTGTATLGTQEPTINSESNCGTQSTNLTATVYPAGGTYLWTPGGETTSSINVSPAITTNYTCVYTYATCPSSTAGTATITVTNPPTASISYAGTPFCTTNGTQSVSLSGTNNYTGGVFSSAGGLSLNGSTGLITPSTSTIGNYTVTYAIPADGPCPSTNVTASIVVDGPPVANAGTAPTICYSESSTVSGATSSNGTILWTVTSGNGTITGGTETTLTPEYNAVLSDAGTTVTLTLNVTSNNSCGGTDSDVCSIIVNPVLTPSIVISSSDVDNTICVGDNVTFTAVPTNGGTTPSYQWQLNGGNVGSNSTTYSSTGLVNSDQVTCILTSNATCASPLTGTSNSILTLVNPILTPSIVISSSDADNTICAGDNVTFTAAPTNGGTTPSYQWQLNGGNVGSNSTTYSTTGLINGDQITCILTSNEVCVSSTTGTSNTITTAVNPLLTPSIVITSSDVDDIICAGENVTFTAVPTNGGATPNYQWQLNGGNVGTNSTTYSTTGLVNGDQITCILTSNEVCVSSSTGTSNTITTTVNPVLTPSIVITSSDADDVICAGTNVIFTAVPTNGGSTPSYQWQLNGGNIGSNSTTYSTTGLVNGDQVTCILTSNATCTSSLTGNSNMITTSVVSLLVPSVVVSSSDADDVICAGDNVTFTATPTNGGTTPSYQWQLNGGNVGSNTTTFSTTGLVNGDQVSCIITSNDPCASPLTGTSNTITTTVNPILTPSIVISSSDVDDVICAGANVTFTASPTNGGTTPSYQWQLNGGNVGSNSTTFSTTGLINGDQVICILTSNEVCVSSSIGTSNTITTTVNPVLTPSVVISSSDADDIICAGDNVTFTAVPTNGGTTPSYQWQLNGGNVGSNSTTFSTTGLANGDQITFILTSNEVCVSSSIGTSNTITTAVNPILTPSIVISSSDVDDIICIGDNVTFTAVPTNGGTSPSYQWQLNGGNIGSNSTTFSSSGLVNGDVIECVLTSSEVCVSSVSANSLTISMTVNSYPVLDPVSNTTYCVGAVLPSITGNNLSLGAAYYTGSEATGSQYIPGDILLIPGVSTLYINDSIGHCHDEESFVITVLNYDDPTFIFNAFCEGQSSSPLGIITQGGTFSFDTPVTDGATLNATTGMLSDAVGGTVYNIQYLTNGECKDSLVLPIVVNANPVAPTLSLDTTYCFSDTIKPINVLLNSGGTLTWYDDVNLTNAVNTGLSYTPTALTSTYYVVETSSTIPACESEESMVTITVHGCEVEIPSAFTPDGDKINDIWELKYIDVNFPENKVKIFNRWGNIVYESTVGKYEKSPWDGKLNGEILPVATYYFIIEYNDNSKENSKGIVTIIRN